MKKIALIILSGLIFISCSSDKEKPDPFLEHDEMVNLMTDLSLAEGARMYARPSHKNRKGEELKIEDYYAMVLTKHGITQVQLDSINAWYIDYPEDYQAIFKEVLDSLNKMQAEEKARVLREAKLLEEEKKEKQRIKDSITSQLAIDSISKMSILKDSVAEKKPIESGKPEFRDSVIKKSDVKLDSIIKKIE
ncbi:MAG: DUF4296 domain-containing protein [Bacteroidota bacterium]